MYRKEFTTEHLDGIIVDHGKVQERWRCEACYTPEDR